MIDRHPRLSPVRQGYSLRCAVADITARALVRVTGAWSSTSRA
jgi:hypothetical protein